MVLIKRKLHFRTVWQVNTCYQQIWKYFIGQSISTLRLKGMKLFGQSDCVRVRTHTGPGDSYICLLHFPVFVQIALITSLFTVLKKGSNKKRTYLLHRHGQDNAAEREHRNGKLTNAAATPMAHSSQWGLLSSPLPHLSSIPLALAFLALTLYFQDSLCNSLKENLYMI